MNPIDAFVDATFAELESVLRWIDNTPIGVDADGCVIQIRSEDLGRLITAVARIALTAPVVAIEPPELAASVQTLAANLRASRR